MNWILISMPSSIFPDNCDVLQVAKGNAFLAKKDIFKNLMWYTLPDSNKQYPLSLERVRKIKTLNQQGVTPDELEPVDVTSSKPKETEPEFVELVGQISLNSLDKAADKKRRQQQQGSRNKARNKAQGSRRKEQATGKSAKSVTWPVWQVLVDREISLQDPADKGNRVITRGGQSSGSGGQKNQQQNNQRNRRNQQRPPNKPPDSNK